MRNLVFKILHVEDDPSDAVIVKQIFGKTSLPLRIDHVTNADDCFRNLLYTIYDLILLDLNLPKTNGMDILNYIHQLDLFIPVIVLTGDDDLSRAVKAVNLGAADYLVKSVESYGSLPEKVMRIIKKYESRYMNELVYKLKREKLCKNYFVHNLFEYLFENKIEHIKSNNVINIIFNPDIQQILDVRHNKVKKMMKILAQHKLLIEKRVGTQIVCPKCYSYNISSRLICPTCRSQVFTKAVNSKNTVYYTCKGECESTISKLDHAYFCSDCSCEFSQFDLKLEPIYDYFINNDMKKEIRQNIKNNLNEIAYGTEFPLWRSIDI